MAILKEILAFQRRLCASFDWLCRRCGRCLPENFTIGGYRDYSQSLLPAYLRPNARIYDIGSGKYPCLDPATKEEFAAQVVGLDIDPDETARAPKGAYDAVIHADVTRYGGQGDADLVLCRALLEHVRDVEGAFATLSSLLKPGGDALLFVPSRNAVFARINLLIPESMKRRLLHLLQPQIVNKTGFPAFYKCCTPSEFRELARRNGLSIVEERLYFDSQYFNFFLPLYIVSRVWVLLFYVWKKGEAAETFSMVLRKEVRLTRSAEAGRGSNTPRA